MRLLFIALMLLFFNTSCQLIVKKIYGVKNPEFENETSIRKAAVKYGLDTLNIVTLDSKYFLQELNGKSIPNASIYDSRGNYIEYRSTDTSCNAGLFDFIPNLDVKKSYNKPDSNKLDIELSKFLDTKGKVLTKLETADFYVLIYWTVWSGKLNKDHVKIWEDAALNNKASKVKVIKVNLDLQDHWDEADKKKITAKGKKTRS